MSFCPAAQRPFENPVPKTLSNSPKAKQARLDHHAPLVIDTRELGRRPGSMLRVQVTAPAPVGLGGQGMAVVTPGSDLELDLRLESVMEGVLVTGTSVGSMSGECGRCLDPVEAPISVDIMELYRYPEQASVKGRGAAAKATAEDEADPETPMLVDDLIDLEPVLRDALVLELPMTPLCSEDCKGLCVGCGERLAELPKNHSHDAVDPRWAALAELRDHAEPSESSPKEES
jgi:uncharacterized protein